jgi:S-adenosylmethionine decarboxylase
MLVGTEWLIDAAGCSPDALRDPTALRSLCERILADLELRVIGVGHWHQFPPPGGLTGLYLLTESHLACHTYPEHGLATFNLHCCQARPRWCWETALQETLAASTVIVREVSRGLDAGGIP